MTERTTKGNLNFYKHVRSVRLQNTGSVARDHLANERTYLAWLRTSLAFASIGVALTQFFRLNLNDSDGYEEETGTLRLSTALGSLFVATGLVVIIIGLIRYFSTQHFLQLGKFPASKGLILICFALTVILVIVTLATLIHVAVY